MRTRLMFTLLSLLSAQAVANRTEFNINTDSLSERACYFDGKRYSEGAELQNGTETIRCGVLDDVTENGALGWLREGDTEKTSIRQRQDDTGRVIEIRK